MPFSPVIQNIQKQIQRLLYPQKPQDLLYTKITQNQLKKKLNKNYLKKNIVYCRQHFSADSVKQILNYTIIYLSI